MSKATKVASLARTLNSSTTGNLNFTETGSRITGDFSNATIANRVLFQTSTTNNNTNIELIPNGSGTTSALVATNSSDPSNAATGAIVVNASEIRLQSSIRGTGTQLPMTFFVNTSERMRIDTSGNVGIGTSSPTNKFHVQASTNNGIRVSDGTYSGSWVPSSLGGMALVTEGAYPQIFYINGSERMRIDSSGNLLVGTTTSSFGQSGFIFNVNYTATGNSGVAIQHVTGSASGSVYAAFAYNGVPIGSISQNGTTAVAYNTSSDYRLKENIKPMQNALATVAQLNPVTYTWKADGSDGQGFIAHELQAVVPDCVTGEKDAVRIVDVLDDEGKVIGTKEEPVYQGIDTSFLVATLTKAIQELKAELDITKAKVEALKGSV